MMRMSQGMGLYLSPIIKYFIYNAAIPHLRLKNAVQGDSGNPVG